MLILVWSLLNIVRFNIYYGVDCSNSLTK